MPDPNDPNGYLIKNLGPENLNGIFELYYDDAAGMRHLVPGANSWRLPIPAGGQASVAAFTEPFVPPPSGTYTLVFHGNMGLEAPGAPGDGTLGAVAAKVVPASSFLLIGPSATYQSIFLDRGWQRGGDGVPLFSPFMHGTYVNRDLMFVGGGIGTGGAAKVYRSEDGGRSFADVSGALVADGTQLRDVAYLGGTRLTGLTVCAPDCGTAYSEDLGASWQKYPQDSNFGLLYGLFFIGGDTLLAQGWGGLATMLYASTDSGATWSRIEPVVDGVPLHTCGLDDSTCFDSLFDTFELERGLGWNQKAGGASVLLATGWLARDWKLGDSPQEPRVEFGIFQSSDGIEWQLNLPAFSNAVALSPDGLALSVLDVWDPPWGYQLVKSLDAGQSWQAAREPDGWSAIASDTVVLMYLGGNLGSQ